MFRCSHTFCSFTTQIQIPDLESVGGRASPIPPFLLRLAPSAFSGWTTSHVISCRIGALTVRYFRQYWEFPVLVSVAEQLQSHDQNTPGVT